MKKQVKGLWMPNDIRADSRLTATEKILLSEIDALYKQEHGCFASNKYLAEFCQCSERVISSAITKFIELDYISVESPNGKNRVIKSNIEKNSLNPRKLFTQSAHILRTENNSENNSENKEKNNNIIIIKKDAEKHPIGFDLDEFFNAACLK